MQALSASDALLMDTLRKNMDNMNGVRLAVLDSLVDLVGCDTSDPQYYNVVYAYDPANQRLGLATHQSGCGLVTEVGWRGAGVRSAQLRFPVGVRSSKGGVLYPVALEKSIAQDSKAWVEPAQGKRPLDGDAVIMGCAQCPGVWGQGTYVMEHEFTIALLERSMHFDGTDLVHSIDGGQPGVRLRTRALVETVVNGRFELWAANLATNGGYMLDAVGRPTVGRRVMGWSDVDALPIQE